MHPVVLFLLVLPILAIGVLIWAARSSSLRPLLPAMSISGVATALTTALLAFTRTTVPIAPYETADGAWWPVAGTLLLALYIGFGVGAALAALIGVPYRVLTGRRRT